MNAYTILFLLPDTYWGGHQSDWIYQSWVEAEDPTEAISSARQIIELEGRDPDEYAVIAVYEGHLEDLYDNS